MKLPQFSYSAYGLRLISDRPIPDLMLLDPSPLETHLRIQFREGEDTGGEGDPTGETPWYTTDIQDADGNPALKIWRGRNDGDYFIRYSHGLSFRLDSSLSYLSIRRAHTISEKDIIPFLLGPVLGIVLRLKGTTCLHASAVEIEGRAFAFVGVPGAGKSTTAAIFADNGHPVLTDDIVALEKRGTRFMVHPGYPFLNLLPDSMALLAGSTEALASPEPAVEKSQVTLDQGGRRFQEEALPLAAIYILAGRFREVSITTIDSLSPREAFVALTANTYGNKMLDATMRAGEFATLGELVSSMPVRRIVAPARPRDPGSFYRAVCGDAAARVQSPVMKT